MRPDQRVWIVALIALFAGASVYVLGRDWSTVYLLAWAADFQQGWPSLQLGRWAGSPPSFAHAFGFALLTVLVLGSGPGRAAGACLFWGATDTLLELLQRPDWAAAIPPLPPELAGWPVLANLPAYFRHGQFDALDVAAIVLGVLAAWLVAMTMPANGSHRSRKLRRVRHAHAIGRPGRSVRNFGGRPHHRRLCQLR